MCIKYLTLVAGLCIGGLIGAPAYAQDVIIDNSDYFVEAAVSNTNPFVGEQIIYSFRLYTAVQLPPASYSPPDFEGFWRTDMGPNSTSTAQTNGRFYTLTQRDTALFANYPGEITIEPARLILPATVFEEGQALSTGSLTLQVRPLPEGAPDGFSGAVGQFNLSATIDRQTVQQGDPLTMRVTVSGTGNVEQLNTPELTVPPGWRTYQNPTRYQTVLQDRLLIGEKEFEWLLTPSEGGSVPLPQITLTYFDPIDLAYRAVNTGGVMLDVVPGDIDMSAASIADQLAPALALKEINSDLTVLGGGLSSIFWVFWLIPPAACALGWWWARQQGALSQVNMTSESAKALSDARRSLQAVRKLEGSRAYETVKNIVFSYVHTKCGGNQTSLSILELENILSVHGINEQLRGRLLACLESADSGLYAPEQQIEIEMLIDRTLKTLTAVDTSWKMP